jgi:hypothetical protein
VGRGALSFPLSPLFSFLVLTFPPPLAQHQQSHAAKAARAAARAAERDLRVARNLERLNTGLATTRSTRLRTRGGNRDVNYEEPEDSPRKRRRVGDEDYSFGDEGEEGGEGAEGSSTRGGGRRSGRNSAASSVAPTRIPGERKSSRLAVKEDVEEGDAEEVEEDEGEKVADSAAVSQNGDAEEKGASSLFSPLFSFSYRWLFSSAVEEKGDEPIASAVEPNGDANAPMDVDSAIAVFEAAVDGEKAEEQQ